MTVLHMPTEKRFPKAGELASRIREMIIEYNGEIGLAEALGVLELVKIELINGQEINHG
ncbi:hypothetical protein [Serratia entomophila]|uniref:hypothetical protein n=1 Tax=Serratia entomophila TaxID=42906 RepID=UPI001F399E08|nr:hypothetical protein [Serratia entomophila]UIW19450.1 hypothetical protein KHA73_05735 [Serratia entomophila]CAI1047679.1 Uncharacterised protein [Serratia entomophila]CAI1065745.1 Uncharacterised protein [Serratia entomophila]CAI1067806.1 Uncharacterised protein [Serratia entomophila]CAI1074952.1 Uncharacterised protein [Serratia entomophila]